MQIAPGATAHIRVWTLGRFRMEHRLPNGNWQEVSPEEWKAGSAGSDARRLLQALLCHQRRLAWRSDLIDELWREQDLAAAEGTLSKAASKLRSLLRDVPPYALLQTIYGRGAYQLAEQAQAWVDADAAECLLSQTEQIGRTTEQGQALLQEAMVYVNGGGFLEAEAGQWAHSRRWEMETARYRCHLWLADAYEQQGALSRAEEQMECLLRLDPTDEAALARLLRLLHQQGMTALARRRYREHKHFLEPQGITLSSTLEALMRHGQECSMPDDDESRAGERRR